MTGFRLSRRGLIFAPTLFLARPGHAAVPYQVAFIWGGFDGVAHQGGLHVVMQPGWKTYWRVPGEGGIPPSIEASGSNIDSFRFDCPLPHRIRGEEGESIGYKDDMVFPFTLKPRDVTRSVGVALSAFIGICESVCIPVPVKGEMVLEPVAMATREAVLLAQWRARVPQVVDHGPVQSVTAGEADGKTHIDIALARPVSDLFVEGNALHYFATPHFSADGLAARLAVHGAKAATDLRGGILRVTSDERGQGLEQNLAVG